GQTSITPDGRYRPARRRYGPRVKSLGKENSMKNHPNSEKCVSRRDFIATATALTAFSIVPRHVLAGAGQPAPSEKMNVGCVGVGGMQGGSDVRNVSSENIYALCDVDATQLARAALEYPGAKLYHDFREMLDKEQKNLHGITITIPD